MDKSKLRCMKCGGLKKMMWGGGTRKKKMTIDEINKGLPMMQSAGTFNPIMKPTEVFIAPPPMSIQDQERLDYRQPMSTWQAPRDLQDEITDMYASSEDYQKKYDKSLLRHGFNKNDSNEKIYRDWYRDKYNIDGSQYIPGLIGTGLMSLANILGPQQHQMYQSNPLSTLSVGQKSFGDTSVAELGGLIFGPSMQSGGEAMDATNIITMYAQATGKDPQEIAMRISQLSPEQQQQMLMRMKQELQRRQLQQGGYNFMGQSALQEPVYMRRGGTLGTSTSLEWINSEARRRRITPREMIQRILLDEDRYSTAAVRRANIAKRLLSRR